MGNPDEANAEMPRVLVTGASGYIASHVILKLLQSGKYRVRGTVRDVNNQRKVEPLRTLYPDAKVPLELVEADLTKAESWKKAVEDCTFVLHVASPFPSYEPANEDELIRPAVEGSLAVLRACAETPSIKRVVLTSSMAAIHHFQSNASVSEADWADVQRLPAYNKSKTLAEKAAWEFMDKLRETVPAHFDLATINPGYVAGPPLFVCEATSMEVVRRCLNREMPLVPQLAFPMCDVRDVAESHIRAMTCPEAGGQRHIVVSATLWMKDMTRILASEFDPLGYNVPTHEAPNLLMKVAGLFDKTIRMVQPSLGAYVTADNGRMRTVLGIEPTPPQQTFVDMGHAAIQLGMARRSRQYVAPKQT